MRLLAKGAKTHLCGLGGYESLLGIGLNGWGNLVPGLAMRRVLIVAGHEHAGGAARALTELVDLIVGTEKATCLVLVPAEGEIVESLRDVGADVRVTGHWEHLISEPLNRLYIPIKYFITCVRYFAGRKRAIRTAENTIDFDTVDVIHTNTPRFDLGIILARRHNIEHVIHLRENSFTFFHCWSYRPNPIAYMNSGASAFIAVSESVAKRWVAKGLDENKIEVIYDGVDQSRKVKNAEAGTWRQQRQLRIVYLGGYDPRKGVWDAVQAVEALGDLQGTTVTLDIYGGGSARLRRQLERFVRSRSAQGRITFHGMTDNIWQELPNYHMGLACSRDEAFGRTVIEYQACGLITVVSDSGSFPELIQDGVNGLIYESERGAEGLKDKIQEVLDENVDIDALVKNGFDNASLYTAEENCRRIEELYDRLLKED